MKSHPVCAWTEGVTASPGGVLPACLEAEDTELALTHILVSTDLFM